jgi:hypothetical protein
MTQPPPYKMNFPLFLLASVLTSSSLHAAISITYSGYGHNGQAEQPAVATPFNTGNIDTTGSPNPTRFSNMTTSDGLATGVSTVAYTEAGSGTDMLSLTSNLRSAATVNDPTYSANKQFNGGNYRYVGVTVDAPGDYSFTFNLGSGPRNIVSGPNGNYHYYGLGGSASVAINNFPAPNTEIYATGASGNIGDPAPMSPTLFSRTTTLSLAPGVTYQISFDNYIYGGFGGTGTIEHNAGWAVAVAAVPEPSSAVVLAGALGLVAARRRRR